MAHIKTQIDQPVLEVPCKDFIERRPEFTVREALSYIRSQQAGEKIVYFYFERSGVHRIRAKLRARGSANSGIEPELNTLSI